MPFKCHVCSRLIPTTAEEPVMVYIEGLEFNLCTECNLNLLYLDNKDITAMYKQGKAWGNFILTYNMPAPSHRKVIENLINNSK